MFYVIHPYLRSWPSASNCFIACMLMLVGCAGFNPIPLEQLPAGLSIETQSHGDVKVNVAIPSNKDAEAIYGVNLAAKQIQPVWLEVSNQGQHPLWFLPSGLDQDYYSPGESAFAFHSKSNDVLNDAIDQHFRELQFNNLIALGTSQAGFVLTNMEDGVKVVDIDLLSHEAVYSLTFFQKVPGFKGDYQHVDIDSLYSPQEMIEPEDEQSLRSHLESLPCCAANEKGEATGDPLNIVLVGDRIDIFAALLRRNWHATERLWLRSLTRTANSFFSGSRYRYSPVSPLYLYSRKQDISLQKSRASIHERNHMRLWFSPLRFRGKEVWVGQISRDIGVKFTLKSQTISTHKIDPDIDDARAALVEDLAYSQSLTGFGAVEGVGNATFSNPRVNLVGDPYYTDGLRVALFFESRPHSIADIHVFEDWIVPRRSVRGYSEDYLGSAEYQSALDRIDTLLRPKAKTQASAGVSVSAVLTSSEENTAILGIDPLEKGVQAVWLEVTNNTERQIGLMKTGLDPDYFSSLELAYANHKPFSNKENALLDQHLQAMDFRGPILPGATVSGFVFINATQQTQARALDIDLVGNRWAQSFSFMLPLSGMPFDNFRKEMETLYAENELAFIEDEAVLRDALQQLPCCVSMEKGDLQGEPLNIVLIGDFDDIATGFGRRGYRNTPTQGRYAYGRRQDSEGVRQGQWVASQPHTIRLWQTPLVYRGKSVWLAQTSNRKGGRFVQTDLTGEAKSLDPDVDEARRNLVQDLVYSQAVEKIGIVSGAGREFTNASTSPDKTLYYFTDHKRTVLFFERKPVPLDKIQYVDW